MLVNDIHTCPDPECALCNIYDELMRNERVKKFFDSKEFTEARKFPVDAAHTDQIMGWGNFTREVLGIDPNTCKNHLLGDCLYFTYPFAWLIIFLRAGIAAANYSHFKYFPSRAAYDAFYEIMLRVVNIASEEFAAYV
jgi:hypothetical protein